MGTEKRLYAIIREAMEHIGGRANPSLIVDYVERNYPEVNIHSIRSLIGAYTVNNKNRIKGYPENQRPTDDPRRPSERYDILFRTDEGELELYNPKIHGYWAICQTDKGQDNPLGLTVCQIDENASRILKESAGKRLSKSEILTLIESFRNFMSTHKGTSALKRRNTDEPEIIRRLLERAQAAKKLSNWDEVVRTVYYGILPSPKRTTEFCFDGPTAPSGATDLPALLRSDGYGEEYIQKQAGRILETAQDAKNGNISSVFQSLISLADSGFDQRIKLGQITPTLFALDSRLLIVNKRTVEAYERMAECILGRTRDISRDLSQYENSLDELVEFQKKLAEEYHFKEALNSHWFNLFCTTIFDWKYEALSFKTPLSRQRNAKRRREIEEKAMDYVMRQEELLLLHKCENVSSEESYDILGIDESNRELYIEIKGHAGDDQTAELTHNEYKLALRERESYVLYIVYNLDSAHPKHIRIADPLEHMNVEIRYTPRYFLS